MKINKGLLAGMVAGVAALAFSSCAYDPYYSSTSYSAGYGHGYGYGSSSFSTSVFVGTGNPRWGYDPFAGCYYDYTRRAYYDPHLYGYYPVGYRPRYVVGAPHPGGWVRGRSYCPPPSRIRSQTLTNYGNRIHSYRSLGMDWSRNVSVTAPANTHSPGFGSRDSRQPGFAGSRDSSFSPHQESFPSRGGSFQRVGDDRDRGSFGRGQSGGRLFGPGNTGGVSPQPAIPSNRPSLRSGDPSGRFQGRQQPPQIQRQPAPPHIERPAGPQLRFERPSPTRPAQGAPGHPRGGDPRGMAPGLRSLGEG